MPSDVKLGSTGLDVELAQNCLRRAGYYHRQIDGWAGYWTVEAIKGFQRATGHTADGWLGPKTWPDLLKYNPQVQVQIPAQPAAQKKHMQCNIPYVVQPNDWTCGVATIQAIAACYGLNLGYEWIVNVAGTNPRNGTGHGGFDAVFRALGNFDVQHINFSALGWDGIAKKFEQGYNWAANYWTGGLPGWDGDFPHWAPVVYFDNNNVLVNCPRKGPSIYTKAQFERAMARQPNPSYCGIKKL